MKPLLPTLSALALIATTAAPALAEPSGRRAPERIIFGQTEASEFHFREFRPLRRSDASTRQAYFGSGEAYSETLSRLQSRMDAIRSQSQQQQLEQLELTPAQEAARDDMAPALVRALRLSQEARDESDN